MKYKKGKILKVIPGINPNCSSGMFAMGYMILSIPVYLVINIVTNVISYKKVKKQSPKIDADIFSIGRSIRRLSWSILIAAIIWLLVLLFTLKVEGDYGNTYTRIMAGVIVSYPPIALIISLLIGEIVLRSRIPKGVFIISPLSFLVVVMILWLLLSGAIYTLIQYIVV